MSIFAQFTSTLLAHSKKYFVFRTEVKIDYRISDVRAGAFSAAVGSESLVIKVMPSRLSKGHFNGIRTDIRMPLLVVLQHTNNPELVGIITSDFDIVEWAIP